MLLELLRRAEGTLKKESRFSELIQRLVNMPFRDLCEGRGACGMMEEAGRFVRARVWCVCVVCRVCVLFVCVFCVPRVGMFHAVYVFVKCVSMYIYNG